MKRRSGLSAKDDGRFVAIDIETGDFEIAARELTACERLYARLADAQIWLKRIGSRHLYSFGGDGVEDRARPTLRLLYDHGAT